MYLDSVASDGKTVNEYSNYLGGNSHSLIKVLLWYLRVLGGTGENMEAFSEDRWWPNWDLNWTLAEYKSTIVIATSLDWVKPNYKNYISTDTF